jgi:SNF2 family DNA or RNA helicase
MYTAVKKFQNFLSRNKLESKPFQTECFRWCMKKEQAPAKQQAEQQQAEQQQAEQAPAEQQQAEQAPAEQQEVHTPKIKPGGILALEMGLGKTIVMLGLLKCNIKAQTLIVLPRSLLEQWEKCIIKFCGCKPLVYHGTRPKNMKMSLAELKTYPIVVTTYGQISLPSLKQAKKGRVRSRLHDILWNRLICDEAHHVTHPKTNEFKGIQALQTEICWLVTGTPLQNNEKELYTLYSLFGLPNCTRYYDAANNYTKAAKQIIFHSTKVGAGLVLPPLHEHTVNLEWHLSEQELAWHIHSLVRFCHVPQKALAIQIEAECENLSALRMKYMAKAQQVCIYPPMLKGVPPFKPHSGENVIVVGDLLGVEGGSPLKITAVIKTLLERRANDCGKIVFCHYYKEIDVLHEKLLQADPTLRIAKFDGRVPNSKRATVLNEPVDILIAQIKMCREGLNLQDHYSEVYFPSPDFNPATEQQAIARCWRIGQKKPVYVFRYLMGGMPPTPPQADIIGGISSPETGGVGGCFACPPGVQGAEPLTMDMFSTKLHEKKREFVQKMTASASCYALLS